MIGIVVVAWNQCDLTLSCLSSIVAADYPTDRLQLVVVDNGSTDGTADAVREEFPRAAVVENVENLGYAGGNNVGIQRALQHGAEYVCILNNDVTVASDFLAPLLRAIEECPEAGVATPLVAGMAQRDRVWGLGSAVNWRSGVVSRLHAGAAVSAWRPAAPFEVEIASGSALLVGRRVFEDVGFFDEAFYLYFEESDWCLRVRDAGYRILAVPSSVVWHKVSATLGQASPVTDYYMVRNHLRFIARHWSGLARVRVLSYTVLRSMRTILAYTLKPHGGARLPHRDARLLALRDAVLGRWGRMGPDVAAVCGLVDR